MKYNLINNLNDDNVEQNQLADNIAESLEKEGIKELEININERLWQPTNSEEITFDFVINNRHRLGLLYDDMLEEDVRVLVDTLIHYMGN